VKKTIQQIREEHGQKAAGILLGYYAEIDALREERKPEAGGYFDRLSDEQRMTLLRDQKREKADAARRRSIAEYRRQFSAYERSLAARREDLQGRLFDVGGSEGAGMLAKTMLADEGELSALLDVAATARNAELSRAVFVAADRRGLGDVLSRYFSEVDPGAQDLYHEWQELPTSESLDRQHEDIPQMLPSPDASRLEAPPQLNR
jgi:hypothetical protein